MGEFRHLGEKKNVEHMWRWLVDFNHLPLLKAVLWIELLIESVQVGSQKTGLMVVISRTLCSDENVWF